MKKPNFAQPVSMPCTLEQFNRDLKEFLEGIGYDRQLIDSEDGTTYNVLCTNWDGCGNHYGFGDGNFERSQDRHYLPAYQPELFKAIAARTKGDVPIVGEWVYYYWKDGDENGLRQVVGIRGGMIDTNVGKNNFRLDRLPINSFSHEVRKPTLTELIEHFTPAEAEKPNDMKKDELRKTLDTLSDGINTLKSLLKEPEQPEFKVRDWVFVLNDALEYHSEGDIGTVLELGNIGFMLVKFERKTNWVYCDNARHATPSEIAEAKAKMVDKELEQKDGEDRLDYVRRLINVLDESTCGNHYLGVDKKCFSVFNEYDYPVIKVVYTQADLINKLKTHIKENR